MNGQLVECIPGHRAADVLELLQDLQREVVSLRQEVGDLRRENADLRRQNLELRQDAGYWKSRHAGAVVRIGKLEAEVEQLRGENRQLQARLFGQKSEQSASRDRSNHLAGDVDPNAASPGPRGQRKGRPGPQRRDYSHLPVVEELRELPASVQGTLLRHTARERQAAQAYAAGIATALAGRRATRLDQSGNAGC